MDKDALATFEMLKGMVRAVRNARAEYNVEQPKKIAAVLVVEDAGLRQAVLEELAVVNMLAKLEAAQVGAWGS